MENTYTGTTWNTEITAPLPMTVTCIFCLVKMIFIILVNKTISKYPTYLYKCFPILGGHMLLLHGTIFM